MLLMPRKPGGVGICRELGSLWHIACLNGLNPIGNSRAGNVISIS